MSNPKSPGPIINPATMLPMAGNDINGVDGAGLPFSTGFSDAEGPDPWSDQAGFQAIWDSLEDDPFA
jgi:hypothetical protein